jgi:hypothetical protein
MDNGVKFTKKIISLINRKSSILNFEDINN